MINDSLTTKIKVIFLSFLFSSLIIMLYFLDKSVEWDNVKTISCIVVCIYAFFLPPTIKYIVNWFKTLSTEEVINASVKIGYHGILILIVIDPVIGVMYYVNKHLKHNNRSRIIMVGWYID